MSSQGKSSNGKLSRIPSPMTKGTAPDETMSYRRLDESVSPPMCQPNLELCMSDWYCGYMSSPQ